MTSSLDDPAPTRQRTGRDELPDSGTAAGRRVRRPRGPRRSWREALAVATAVLALIAGLGSLAAPKVPSLQAVLQQSFTRLPSAYTELYFGSTPTIDGVTVSVPVTVVDHNTGAKSYQVRVDQESDQGTVLATDTVTLVPHNGRPVTVVARFAFRAGATQVRVTLPGHPQSLHYRIAGSPVGATRSTP